MLKLSAAFILACVHPVLVLGQINYRVDQRNPNNTGRALDRSFQVGSSGINQPVRSAFDSGYRANSIVTGNMSGLARFKANSPILGNNQFRVNLPSAGLSGFQRTSVGLSDVRSRQVVLPAPFQPRAETVSDLNYITRGMNVPGSSALRSPFMQAPTANRQRIREQLLDIRDVTDTRLQLNQSFKEPPRTLLNLQSTAMETPSPFSAASSSSIFGVPAPSVGNRMDLVPPLVDPDIMRAMGQGDQLSPGLYGEGGIEGFDLKTGDEMLMEPSPAALPEPQGPVETGPEYGGDTFSDLHRALSTATEAQRSVTGFAAPRANADPADGPRDISVSPEELPNPDEIVNAYDKGAERLSVAVQWADEIIGDPVGSFVGRYESRLNQYMAGAEEALKQGAYYNAARQYQLARTIDPTNPLPLLGRGHALAAAGDYLSAVLSLERGLRRFPQIAAFRLDLPALVGQHDIFDIRRADLENRLAEGDNYKLRFLLGYLELYSGLQQEGIRDLEQAAKAAPQNSMIAIFPDLVLGRRSLPPLSDRH